MFKIIKIILLLLVAIPLICIGVFALCFNFYTGDLPDVRQLAIYDGSSPGELNKLPGGEPATLIVISSNQMGHIGAAVLSAEGEVDTDGAFSSVYRSLTEDVVRVRRRNYALQVARFILRGHYRSSHRAIAEMRYAHQMERHFTQEQIFTIHQNIADFGNEHYGVEAASQYYFGRSAEQLSFADAALLAGMIQAPTGYSPWRHPERAIERRNKVLDRMLLEGRIPAADCETAKTAPIGVKAQPLTAP